MGILGGLLAHIAAPDFMRVLRPHDRLRRRAEEVEVRGSVDTKLALAAKCRVRGMHAEAIRLYESCLQGVYANDSSILFRLASVAVDGGEWDRATTAIGRLKSGSPKTRPLEVRLLEARVLEGRGRDDEALAVYHELVAVFVGLEARYRLGALLLRLGHRQAAIEMFDEVLGLARRFASPIEEEERWVSASRRALRAA